MLERFLLRILLFCICFQSIACPAQDGDRKPEQIVRIHVLSLFRPTELRLEASKDAPLQLEVDGQDWQGHALAGQGVVLIRHTAAGQLRVEQAAQGGDEAANEGWTGSKLLAHGRSDLLFSDVRGASWFWLEVPGKLRREYFGSLEIRVHGPVLEAIVTMPLETAVASIVQAESFPAQGGEALKAQSVAARSFLVARQTGHAGFDFCDTTHCQFLRSPPAVDSAAAKAATATKGLVLTYRDEASAEDRTLAAMYARSCGGRTRSLREIGIRSASGYPYYAVRCTYCTRHPEAWWREESGLAGHRLSERERLAWNRIHGWGAIPSVGSETYEAGGSVLGRGVGHGVGLCQLGAVDMAQHGAGFAAILAHYYPNTRLTSIP
jgi:hypothetical protein